MKREWAELREQLAAIEHERWSHWQRYMHDQMLPMTNPREAPFYGMLLPSSFYERWERQIATPYQALSAAEKASDMEQVDRYWPLIQRLLDGEEHANG